MCGIPTVSTLPVVETFKSFQGEGPSAGRAASFVRLGGCNLSCSWCDTPHSWDASRFDLRAEITRQNTDDIAERIRGHLISLVVITGGEPLLHQGSDGWSALLRHLPYEAYDVEVETNGTIAPITGGLAYNVSPKLTHSGQPAPDLDVLRTFADYESVFKFVVTDFRQLDEVSVIIDAVGVGPEKVWIMPEGIDGEDVIQSAQMLAAPVLDRGYNLTLRQHVLLWGNERGR